MHSCTLAGEVIYAANSAICQFNLRLNPEAVIRSKAFAIFCAQAVAISFIACITYACTDSAVIVIHACIFSNQINKAAIVI